MNTVKSKYLTTLFSFLFAFGALLPLHGQQLTWMPPQPGIKKFDQLFFLGSNEKEVLAKTYDDLFVLDATTMKVKKTLSLKDISQEKGERYADMLKLENGWVAVVSSFRPLKKDSDYEVKTARLTETGFEAPQPWLTIARDKIRDNMHAAYHFEGSENGKYILAPHYDKASGTAKRIVYDANFKEVYSKPIPGQLKVGGSSVDLVPNKEFVDNDGNFYLVGVLEDKSKKHQFPFIYKYDRVTDKAVEHIVAFEGGVIAPTGFANDALSQFQDGDFFGQEIAYLLHEPSGRLIVAGVFGNPNGGGFFTLELGTKSNLSLPLKKYSFPADLKAKISKESYKGKEVKGNLLLQDLLVKANGDLMCVMEIEHGGSGMSNQGVSKSDFAKPILYFNIGADREISYYGNIHRVREDAVESIGDQLSFIAMANGNEVNIAFNELKKEGRSFINYRIDEKGVVEKKDIGRFDKDTKTQPSKANRLWLETEWMNGISHPIQISGNAVLTKAIKDGTPTLLKISY